MKLAAKGIAATDQWKAVLRDAGRDLTSLDSARWLVEQGHSEQVLSGQLEMEAA